MNELYRVKSLICKTLKGDLESFEMLKTMEVTDKDAYQLRKIFVALIELVYRNRNRKKDYISYSELASHANKIYPHFKLPEQGGSLAKVVGSILGELSFLSYCCCDFLISAVVTKKGKNKQGKGFFELVRSLEENENKIKNWIGKTKEIAERVCGR